MPEVLVSPSLLKCQVWRPAELAQWQQLSWGMRPFWWVLRWMCSAWGRQQEKLSTDPHEQWPPSASIPGFRGVGALGAPQAGTDTRLFSLQF